MNKTSRTDEPRKSDGYNQSPRSLSNDLTTNADLNGISNSREVRRGNDPPSAIQNGDKNGDAVDIALVPDPGIELQSSGGGDRAAIGSRGMGRLQLGKGSFGLGIGLSRSHMSGSTEAGAGGADGYTPRGRKSFLHRLLKGFKTFGSFVGPGFMVAVAYSKLYLIVISGKEGCLIRSN